MPSKASCDFYAPSGTSLHFWMSSEPRNRMLNGPQIILNIKYLNSIVNFPSLLVGFRRKNVGSTLVGNIDFDFDAEGDKVCSKESFQLFWRFSNERRGESVHRGLRGQVGGRNRGKAPLLQHCLNQIHERTHL